MSCQDRYDLTIVQHTAYTLQVTSADENENPIDLTGYEGLFVIRRTMASPDAELRVEHASGQITIAGAVEDNVQVTLTATQTGALSTNNREVEGWVYELVIWDPNDEDSTKQRLLYGDVTIIPSASRPDAS